MALVFALGQDKKLAKMDEQAIDSLIADITGDGDDGNTVTKQKQAATAKAMRKVEARLANERKQQARKNGTKKKGGKQEAEDLDEDDLLTFVKPSENKK